MRCAVNADDQRTKQSLCVRMKLLLLLFSLRWTRSESAKEKLLGSPRFGIVGGITGPCGATDSSNCIQYGTPQCSIDNATELTEMTVEMDTDLSVVLKYNIKESSSIGVVVFDHTQCKNNLIGYDETHIDVGSVNLGSIRHEFGITNQGKYSINQFRINGTVDKVFINVFNVPAERITTLEQCTGAGTNIEGDTSEVTANGTVIKTENPYRNDQSWTRHARCAPGQFVHFKLNRLDLEIGYDFATLIYDGQQVCLNGYLYESFNMPYTSWMSTNSDLLLVSFYSDMTITASGFEVETQCVQGSVETNEVTIATLRTCLVMSTRVFLLPGGDNEETATNDYTECFGRSIFPTETAALNNLTLPSSSSLSIANFTRPLFGELWRPRPYSASSNKTEKSAPPKAIYTDAARFGIVSHGPCSSFVHGVCIAREAEPQCMIRNSVELSNFTVHLDSDKSVLMSFDINDLNSSYIGMAVIDHTLCSSDFAVQGGQLRTDIGSSIYGEVRSQFGLFYQSNFTFGAFSDRAAINQFRVDKTANKIVLNIFDTSHATGFGVANDIWTGIECPGAGANIQSDLSETTPNGTVIETTHPYANDESWTRHVRCEPGQHVIYKFNQIQLERRFDFLTIAYDDHHACLSGNMNDTGNAVYGEWHTTNTELMMVSFFSDVSITRYGFTMNTMCMFPGEHTYEPLVPNVIGANVQCQGAGENLRSNTTLLTPNLTTIETENPYLPMKSWTQHVRCVPGENVFYRINRLHLEVGYDFLTLIYENGHHCLSGTLTDPINSIHSRWINTNTNLLLVSFYSDFSIQYSGFKIETKCSNQTEIEIDRATLSECLLKSTRVFLLPDDNEDDETENDYTECFAKDYFNFTDLCDNDACQLPPGATCPSGNQWYNSEAMKPQSRILGGRPATPHSWPWAVQLVDSSGGQYCGGTLVTDKWVITAAHCCEGSSFFGIHSANVGNHFVAGGDEVASIPIKQSIIHPQYDGYQIVFDYCMIELEYAAPVDNERVQVACFSSEHIEPGAKCWTAGWGTQLGPVTELHTISVEVYPDNLCNQMDYFRTLDPNAEFCAGHYGISDRDSCYGDSGGPVVCQTPGSNVTTLYGITSWGTGCGMPTSVGVYAKVATAIEWIGNVVNGDYVAPVEESWTIPTWTDWSFTDFWIFGTTSQPTWMDDLQADHQLPDGLVCTGNRWFTNDNIGLRSTRIVSGQTVSGNNKWPWVVNVSIGKRSQQKIRSNGIGVSHCSGTILTNQYILTAGRCCDGSLIEEIGIYAGSNNFYNGVFYEASEIIIHPDYDEPMHDNDICLIRTKKPIRLDNETTAVMCLTEHELNAHDEMINESECWVAGWGHNMSYSASQPTTLKSMSASIDYCSDNDEHLTLLCTPPSFYSSKLCSGDIGAPLVCRLGDQLFQLGVTIRHHECNHFYGATDAALYTDLRRFTGWIDSVLGTTRENTATSSTTRATAAASGTSTSTTTGNQTARERETKPPLLSGLSIETVAKATGSFFDMMSSFFQFLTKSD